MSKTTTIKRTLDLSKAPRVSAAQKVRLAAVAAMPDSKIDYSDAPALPQAQWMRVAELPNSKQQITLRLDADVLE